jgi:glycosyltransferase involved in cell wall biosynthesis
VAEALARRGFRVTLIDQASRETVQDMPATLRVFDAVSRSAMRELFGHSKVFISLSRAEGYGLTPLEALSQGCRVVTTPTPSTSRFESAALVVVTGDDELEARTVDIAMAQLAEAGLDKCSGAFEYTGPFMEDWSADAVRTLSLEGAVR